MNNNFIEQHAINFSPKEILLKIVNEIMLFFEKIKKWNYSDHYDYSYHHNLEYDINNIIKKVTFSDADKLDLFQTSIVKRLSLNDVNENTDLSLLIMFTNAHLNLLKTFLEFVNSKSSPIDPRTVEEINVEYKNASISTMLQILKFKNFCFNKKSFFIYSVNQDMQLELLNEKKLNVYFQDFLSSASIPEKTLKIVTLSCAIQPILNELKKDKNYIVHEYFNKSDITRLIEKCQGLRHLDEKDSNLEISKFSKEWFSYKPETKIQMMDNIFSMYLTILTMLKGANLLDEFLKKLN